MLENLVSSLEMGKKLKAAGWNKPTTFIWAQCRDNDNYEIQKYGYDCEKKSASLPALLAEEALNALPNVIRKDEINYYLSTFRTDAGEWWVYYEHEGQKGDDLATFRNKSLTEAACEMWLWCKEQGYTK